MVTRIYSCGTEANYDPGNRVGNDPHWVWFPEVTMIWGKPVPVHPVHQIEKVPGLVGKTIVTISEHIILAFLKMVRDGDMKPDDLMLYCSGRRIRVDVKGELIDDWDGGFFRERAQLLF